MAEKRIHNPDKSSSADVIRGFMSHDQDGHHTHICEKPQLLCPVTVLVDSQVSDRCPWTTCYCSHGAGNDAVLPLRTLPTEVFFHCNWQGNKQRSVP